MTLDLILISIVVAAFLSLLMRSHWRIQLLLGISALAVYAFQPALPVRGLDFWLPFSTLALSILTWIITTPREKRSWQINWSAVAILGGVTLILALTRYIGTPLFLTASRPPQTLQVFAGLAVVSLVTFLLAKFTLPNKAVLILGFIILISLFIVLKVPWLVILLSGGLRSLNHQSTNLASVEDFRWLGFSYLAFRLLHTIRDRQTGRLPLVTLSEYIIYIIFFPSLTAGPIDRIERFVGDLRRSMSISTDDLGEAGKRIIIGLFKKFALADMLAMIALNTTNALQVRSAGWAWILLYAYAFQIYFDFSGYTDIAIGLGRLLGIKLPENFNAPYLKTNLTQFWNSWHITLTQWFRAYFFNPMTRALRSRKRPIPIPVIIFITQVLTMIVIGLWHGGTLNFVVWGLWHGSGLFVQNRWSELTRVRFAKLTPRWHVVLNIGGALLTFNYIAIGWVFFSLPNLSISTHFLRALFNLA